jgi:hypothetical protein
MVKNVRFVMCVFISLFLSTVWAQNPKHASRAERETSVARSGNSTLETDVEGTPVRIAITTYQIDIGRQGAPPQERMNNCTYSSFPCSQVSSLRIRVKGTDLFVPRSVFADCADVGNMGIASEPAGYVLTLTGGDASEAYRVKIFFTADQVKKREVYDLESGSMRQSTIYTPQPVLD